MIPLIGVLMPASPVSLTFERVVSMIYDKVVQMLSYQLGIDEDKISSSSDIFEDLGADSLDVVMLLMTLEDEFGMTIEDDQAQEFHTVGDIVSFIETNS